MTETHKPYLLEHDRKMVVWRNEANASKFSEYLRIFTDSVINDSFIHSFIQRWTLFCWTWLKANDWSWPNIENIVFSIFGHILTIILVLVAIFRSSSSSLFSSLSVFGHVQIFRSYWIGHVNNPRTDQQKSHKKCSLSIYLYELFYL